MWFWLKGHMRVTKKWGINYSRKTQGLIWADLETFFKNKCHICCNSQHFHTHFDKFSDIKTGRLKLFYSSHGWNQTSWISLTTGMFWVAFITTTQATLPSSICSLLWHKAYSMFYVFMEPGQWHEKLFLLKLLHVSSVVFGFMQKWHKTTNES